MAVQSGTVPAVVFEHRHETRFYQEGLGQKHLQHLKDTYLENVDERKRKLLKGEVHKYGEIPGVLRTTLWPALVGHGIGSSALAKAEARYHEVLEKKVNSCVGCANLITSHLPTFGASFLQYSSNFVDLDHMWFENVFRHHLLSETGIKAAKRVMLALSLNSDITYCPVIPDLVCILLLYLPEPHAFAVTQSIIDSSTSSSSSRWNSKSTGDISEESTALFYFPTDEYDAQVFSRTFADVFASRLPNTYRACVAHLTSNGSGKENEAHSEISALLQGWQERLFMTTLPIRYVVRLLDCLLVDGAKIIYRFGLSLLKIFRKEIKKGAKSFILVVQQEIQDIEVKRMAASAVFKLQNTASSSSPANLNLQDSPPTSVLGFSLSPVAYSRTLQKSPQKGSPDATTSTLTPKSSFTSFGAAMSPEQQPRKGSISSDVSPLVSSRSLFPISGSSMSPHSAHANGVGDHERRGSLFRSFSAQEMFGTNASEGRRPSLSNLSFAQFFRSSSSPKETQGPDVSALGSAGFDIAPIDLDEDKFRTASPTNFNYHYLMDLAFGLRNLSRKQLRRFDLENEKDVTRTSHSQIQSFFASLHFSDQCFKNSQIITDCILIARLVEMLPVNTRGNVNKMTLVYTTNVHKRSLEAFYSNISGRSNESCILIFEAEESTNDERKPGLEPLDHSSRSVFGVFLPSTSQLERGNQRYSGPGHELEHSFLFRLTPGLRSCCWPYHVASQTSAAKMTTLDRFGVNGHQAPIVQPRDSGIRIGCISRIQESVVGLVEQEVTDNQIESAVLSSLMDEFLESSNELFEAFSMDNEIYLGPALYISSDMIHGFTSYSSTFRNEPLTGCDCASSFAERYQNCGNGNVVGGINAIGMKTEDIKDRKRCQYFTIKTLEVYTVPKQA